VKFIEEDTENLKKRRADHSKKKNYEANKENVAHYIGSPIKSY
jgi:hypothetical protein